MDPKPPSFPKREKRAIPPEKMMEPNFDESVVNPDILEAVRAIRNAGIETIASNSGIGQIGQKNGWGSYIQIQLMYEKEGRKIAEKISAFAQALTVELQKELTNPAIFLQLVSSEKWYSDPNTTSLEIKSIAVYRLQLVGATSDEQIRYAWKRVAEKFSY